MRSPPIILALLTTSIAACSPSTSNSERDGVRTQMDMMSDEQARNYAAGGMNMMGGGMMDRGMMDDAGTMGDMMTIRQLLANHEQIERKVENVSGGVRSVTVSDNPEVSKLIREHVREMKARYGRDQPIRMMDPVFRELFRHRDRATMKIEDIPRGVRVLHTSDDPEVISLIRQHAHEFVSEAAEQGVRRAMQPTALPQDYRPKK